MYATPIMKKHYRSIQRLFNVGFMIISDLITIRPRNFVLDLIHFGLEILYLNRDMLKSMGCFPDRADLKGYSLLLILDG